ncbi:ureidoglycolate hydrolase-like protein [Stipitochalara longipes BDJ]|nr:ureidoglycolate hydrolase-like protein [Stipitochalara longipes BDJ]
MGLSAPNPAAPRVIEAEILSQRTFADFGTVIENPAPGLIPSLEIGSLPANSVQANQGSALKYLNVTHMVDLYGSAPSHEPAKAVVNMFVCAPRPLLRNRQAGTAGEFPVKILERHPFTSQTFIPLGLSQSESHKVRYFVIVAPTLSPSSSDEGLPVPMTTDTSGPLPGRGLPDVKNIRAFVASGSQAVTYGAGTWHAPMVVVGQHPIDFVVVQFANGVAVEDCQERDLEERERVLVAVTKPHRRWWKL